MSITSRPARVAPHYSLRDTVPRISTLGAHSPLTPNVDSVDCEIVGRLHTPAGAIVPRHLCRSRNAACRIATRRLHWTFSHCLTQSLRLHPLTDSSARLQSLRSSLCREPALDANRPFRA